MPAMPIAEISAPIVVGMRHKQGDQDGMAMCRRSSRTVERDDARRKTSVSTASRMFSASSFGVFYVRLLDERDHSVEERLARIGGHPDEDPVGQHSGAAGHCRTVAAGLADDRGGLTGNCRDAT